MVQAINLKKGMIFSQDGKLIKVLKANHHKPGKGNTVMQMDLRDVKSGAVVHKTMRPTEKVDLVEVTKKKAQYLYGEGDTYTFMDTDTYDQYEVSADQLGDDVKFLMPNIMVDMDFTDDNKIIGIELPYPSRSLGNLSKRMAALVFCCSFHLPQCFSIMCLLLLTICDRVSPFSILSGSHFPILSLSALLFVSFFFWRCSLIA